MADDDSVPSSDSDEDFLTLNAEGGTDREAMVRKKLLENFYGSEAVAEQTNLDTQQQSSSETPSKRSPAAKNDDLDSPHFDAQAYVKNLIETSNVHELLEVEEKLALEVRNLDSTMQTLVYENYSRFIEATDAIRSIGVNVQSNERGLSMLTKAMENVNDSSRVVDTALGELRDQVAEKIRIQRLLTRLDALLKLPTTLEEQILVGKYKTATSSYLNARTILAQHSQGFESLKSIETECNAILEKLKIDLKSKLLYWSGRLTESYDSENSAAPSPPSSMSDVFEVSGTMYVLLQEEADDDINLEDIASMCISAAMRLLDRLLDTHLLEVQERRFAATLEDDANPPTDGSTLIPSTFLNDLLECVVLYGKTFNPEDNFYVIDFTTEAYNNFLSHARSILLEESIQANKEDNNEGGAGNKEISGALTLLVQYVEDFASGLAGQDISQDFISKLVDQAVDLSDSMVRRRVEQKFQDLRASVVKDCLLSFAELASEERARALQEDRAPLSAMIQIASSTLSDCLQLVDDAIRSIFSEAGSDDPMDLKDAVHNSTSSFILWLANAFEILAGGESSDPRHLVEAPVDYEEADSDDESNVEGFDAAEGPSESALSLEFANDDKELLECIDAARQKLSGDDGLQSDFVLSILELCRISEDSVAENLEQSFNAHIEGAKRKSRGLFPTSEKDTALNDSIEVVSRFKLASSHVLRLFATDCGFEAAAILCKDLVDVSVSSNDDFVELPRDAVLEMLAVAKRTALSVAGVLGCSARGGKFPEWKEDGIAGFTSSALGRKTGLSLDVERMFKENVVIFPHPSKVVEASNNAVLFLFFKTAFKALFEHARLLSFSSAGLHQIFLDTTFLKHVMPHYVNEEFADEGANACSALQTLLDDVIEVAEQRCSDDQAERLKQSASSSIQVYVEKIRNDPSVGEQFIISEDRSPEAAQ